MGKYFGAEGFRGEANVELTVDHVYRIGRFIGWYYSRDHRAKVVIGKDTRRSSYMFEDALSAGLTASGADVYLLHVTPTPSVAYVVRTEEDFDCGIMISAGSDPFSHNGIRLLNGRGEKLEETVIREVERYLDGEMPEVPLAVGEHIGCTTDYSAGRNRYVGYLMTLATRSFKNMRVGLDCANGSAFSIARTVFEALGARTYVINDHPDGTNINRVCGSARMEALQKFVVERQLDVGFAYDGDADCCLAVDENGQVVDGEAILYICAGHMQERGLLTTGKVVTTARSAPGLCRALEKAGIGCEMTREGERSVYETMLENGHRLGGEQNGQIIFSKYASTGDGVLTSLKVMEILVEKRRPLSELAEPIRREIEADGR